jgi:hypothetical protein
MKTHDSYWQHDLSLGKDVFYRNEAHPLRMRLHVARERYCETQEIVPLAHASGYLTFIHATSYIIPSTDWVGIGMSHAWYYHQDRLLIIWECYLPEFARRTVSPQSDTNLTAVWTSFENLLLAKFPASLRIGTRSWDESYELHAYQAFLATQGYAPVSTQAFLKEVAPQ